jgi:hypothetical protein
LLTETVAYMPNNAVASAYRVTAGVQFRRGGSSVDSGQSKVA